MSLSNGDPHEDKSVTGGFADSHQLFDPDYGCSTGNGTNRTAEYARHRSRVLKGRNCLGLLCGKRLPGTSEIQRVFQSISSNDRYRNLVRRNRVRSSRSSLQPRTKGGRRRVEAAGIGVSETPEQVTSSDDFLTLHLDQASPARSQNIASASRWLTG